MRLLHNLPEKMLFAANAFLSACINLFGNKSLQPSEILVVKIDEIGDMISATPVFKLLREKYPNAKINLLCKPICKTFMQFNPNVDFIFCSVSDWKKRYELVIELRGTRATLLKSLQYLPSYRLDRGTVRFNYRPASGNLSDRETNFLVIKPLLGESEMPLPELFSSPSDKDFIDNFLTQNNLQHFAILHAASNLPVKEWAHERFARLADILIEQYGFQIVLIGAKSESERIASLIKLMKHKAMNLAGAFSLTQLFEFCKRASLYVGNDSGPMHIANVAGTPLVGLFGPVPYGVFYPFGQKARVIHHISNTKSGESSMETISVEEVLAEIKLLLE
ncbi:MAG: glycosyltransferase family 9 protein [Bacteroidetes bacterium]|nr:glycosyltransferase family 9 protein [Bacteroidota bacterium]